MLPEKASAWKKRNDRLEREDFLKRRSLFDTKVIR